MPNHVFVEHIMANATSFLSFSLTPTPTRKNSFPSRSLTERWSTFSLSLSQLRQRHSHFCQEWDKVKAACESLLAWIADVTNKVIADVEFKVTMETPTMMYT